MKRNKWKKLSSILKKLILMFGLVLILISIFTILDERPTFADSGFGTSYGGGGGGSSGGSGSTGGSGSDSGFISGLISDLIVNLIYSTGGMNGIYIVDLIIVIVCIIIIVVNIKKRKNRLSTNKYGGKLRKINYTIPDQEYLICKIKENIPTFNKDEFLQQGFVIYKNVQNAWMNFKLENVKDVITDELYNMYESQLDTLEVKGEQNVMKDIVLNDKYLKNVSVENNIITVTNGYVIELYDYITEVNTGKVLRGTKRRKIQVLYEMSFRKTLDENKQVKYCPNCGAKLNMNNLGTCEYCGSKIVSENTKWVLTEKKVLYQEKK